VPVRMLSDVYITALFDAVVECTEEAIVNAILSAETMTGRDEGTAHALPGRATPGSAERVRAGWLKRPYRPGELRSRTLRRAEHPRPRGAPV
jgi:Peptidase family S58